MTAPSHNSSHTRTCAVVHHCQHHCNSRSYKRRQPAHPMLHVCHLEGANPAAATHHITPHVFTLCWVLTNQSCLTNQQRITISHMLPHDARLQHDTNNQLVAHAVWQHSSRSVKITTSRMRQCTAAICFSPHPLWPPAAAAGAVRGVARRAAFMQSPYAAEAGGQQLAASSALS